MYYIPIGQPQPRQSNIEPTTHHEFDDHPNNPDSHLIDQAAIY